MDPLVRFKNADRIAHAQGGRVASIKDLIRAMDSKDLFEKMSWKGYWVCEASGFEQNGVYRIDHQNCRLVPVQDPEWYKLKKWDRAVVRGGDSAVSVHFIGLHFDWEMEIIACGYVGGRARLAIIKDEEKGAAQPDLRR